jgi:hypothetical protein
MSISMRTQVVLPVGKISSAINGACGYTAVALATDFRDYLLLRFAEPKSGHRYYIPRRGWYQASAPGEYPAIRYGILYQSMRVAGARIRQNGATCRVGASTFSTEMFGASYPIPPDPKYAREVEGLEGPGPYRPYFVRAMLETRGNRHANAGRYFVAYLMGREQTLARTNLSIGHGEDALGLLPAMGRTTFPQIASEIASGSAQVAEGSPIATFDTFGPAGRWS